MRKAAAAALQQLPPPAGVVEDEVGEVAGLAQKAGAEALSKVGSAAAEAAQARRGAVAKAAAGGDGFGLKAGVLQAAGAGPRALLVGFAPPRRAPPHHSARLRGRHGTALGPSGSQMRCD